MLLKMHAEIISSYIPIFVGILPNPSQIPEVLAPNIIKIRKMAVFMLDVFGTSYLERDLVGSFGSPPQDAIPQTPIGMGSATCKTLRFYTTKHYMILSASGKYAVIVRYMSLFHPHRVPLSSSTVPVDFLPVHSEHLYEVLHTDWRCYVLCLLV